MRRILGLARNPVVRGSFLVAALGLATWAVARDWGQVTAAMGRMRPVEVVAAVLASFAYVGASMQSWRAVMADLGSPLGIRDSADVFLVSQVGKYVPGGVWNVVAGAELGKDKGVARARTASALAMTMLVSIFVGVALAGIGLALAPDGFPAWTRWGVVITPIALVLLVPRLLSRVLAFALRVVRRPGASAPFTARGVLVAASWAAGAWAVAGLQVWMLAVGLGLAPTPGTFLLATAGFAAAWLVGLAILFLPAGVGARELVLFPVFAHHLDRPTVVALVVASRVLFTIADGVLAAVPLLHRRLRRRRPVARSKP